MKFLDPRAGHASEDARQLHAAYEIAYTAVDFAAALCFVVGSALFFRPALETQAIWLFLIGSLFFALKPSLRLAREIHLWRRGRTEDLARRLVD